jgi:hypothetical protein
METELFRVVASTYRFWCGDEVFDAPPGTIVVLPPHVEHAWRDIGDAMGQMLGIVTPGGCEGIFRDIAALGPGASMQDIATIETRYRIVNEQTRALAAIGLYDAASPYLTTAVDGSYWRFRDLGSWIDRLEGEMASNR